MNQGKQKGLIPSLQTLIIIKVLPQSNSFLQAEQFSFSRTRKSKQKTSLLRLYDLSQVHRQKYNRGRQENSISTQYTTPKIETMANQAITLKQTGNKTT